MSGSLPPTVLDPGSLDPGSLAVVIPAHNRPAGIVRCLDALSRQTVRGFAVVVVDDGSDQPVVRLVPPALWGTLDLRVIRFEHAGGPARARNAGVAATNARRILFVDDDVEPHERLVEHHLQAAATDPLRTVVIGPLAAPRDWKPTPWNRWEWRQLLAQYRAMREGRFAPTWRQFYTGNASVARAAFDAANGFDERFTRAEDVEFAFRLGLAGCRFVFEPLAVGWHHAERSLQSWLAIPDAYGRYEVAIARLHPECDWMENLVHDELPRRRFASLMDRVARHRRLARSASSTIARVAAPADAAGLRRLSQGALSAAYDLSYRASLYAALRGDADAGLAGSRLTWRPIDAVDGARTAGQPALHAAGLR